MLTKVRKQIEQFHMLNPGNRVLVGLSGGADSVCLLQVLFLLREEYGIELGALHCHHGIRGADADGDAEFARNFCRERGISFYYAEEEVEERARKKKMSVEEAGREFRYETFYHVMEEECYERLAVAHNANDRAETMLFHLARGTGLAGLSAMESVVKLEKKRSLIRPLLKIERSQIEEWLISQHLVWRTDKTNLSDLYTRNRIRHHVLPELINVNRQAVNHMGKTAEAVEEVLDYLKLMEEQAADEIRVLMQEPNEKKTDRDFSKKRLILRADKLKEYHPYLQKSLLYRFLSEITGSKKDISSVHIELLKGLAEGESGRELSLARGIRARKEYDKLILFYAPGKEKNKPKASEEANRKVKEKKGTSQADIPNLELEIQKIAFHGQEISKKKYTKFFDCDKIKSKLCLRFWQPGDYLYLREDGGRKKLNRYFIDEKIPAEERGRIPLLADGDHILWIVGYRMSAYYKVTAKTRYILSVTIKQKMES